MANFEVFTRKNAKPAREPTLTITVRGTLNLNAAAYELLGKPEAVTLLYARAERVIGLRPTDRGEQNAYLVRPLGKSGSSWQVSAKEFSVWIEADLGAARRYPLALNDDIGCADLTRPGQIVAGPRSRRD